MNRFFRQMLRQYLERILADQVTTNGAVNAVQEAWIREGLQPNTARKGREMAELAIRAFVEHVL